jgi:protein O-GlcNAc transferase
MADVTIPEALHLAAQHHQAGRLPEAESIYRTILARDPGSVGAWHGLGILALQVGRYDVAVELLRRAAALVPGDPAVHSNLGEAYRNLNRLDEAVASFRQALALQPDFADALNNLGNALTTQGRLNDAIDAHRLAVALRPNAADGHYNLGIPLTKQGRYDEAIACFQQALALKPDFAGAFNNLGKILNDRGQFDEALRCLQQAVAHQPNLAEAYTNLGFVFANRGQLEEAIASHRRALELKPDYAAAHSNLILVLHYHPALQAGVIDAEIRRWHHQHARQLAKFILPHANDRTPDRRLRIGYVSPDFRLHSVAFFLLPLLEAHDRGQLHVTGYSTNAGPSDYATARFQACTDAWRSVGGLSDEALAQRIREDRIDVLVDLSGHTAGNRLRVFARQPAPIQVSYLGYPGSTGLETIGYRITDVWADPPHANAGYYAEELMRLPDSAWCFAPLSGCPPVSELPALRRGYLTFGCFNNFAKVTEDVLRLWARILQRVPGSHLVVKNQAISTPSVAQRLRTFFGNSGISADRLELCTHQETALAHLQCYDRVDLALDTFPYQGTTTTCEALWMGVPVLSLAGNCHRSRVGVSLLTSVGLTEFVAHSPDAYVEAAVAATRDLPRLADLRASLRGRMQRSPLMDAPRLARAIEQAYRAMWHRWCAQPQIG